MLWDMECRQHLSHNGQDSGFLAALHSGEPASVIADLNTILCHGVGEQP
jgi:hypothetical protein